MSPTIRSVGGLPLLVDGMVASADSCCCENPTICRCFETCSFDLAVTSPSKLAVATPPLGVDCGGPLRYNASSWIGYSFVGVEAPLGFTPFELEDRCPDKSRMYGQVYAWYWTFGWTPGMLVRVYARQVYGNPGYTLPFLVAEVQAEVYIFCIDQQWGGYVGPAKWRLYVDIQSSVSLLGNVCTDFGVTQRRRTRRRQIDADVESFCAKNNARACSNPTDDNSVFSDRVQFLTTPLTFDLTGDSISIPHTAGPDVETSSLTASEEAALAPFHQDIIDAVETATISITSRDNCKSPVACNCDASLGGMQVTLGNLKQITSLTPSEYVVDSSIIDSVWMYGRSDEKVTWQGPGGSYEYDQRDPDGPQDGDGKFTRILWVQRAELYCDLIDGVSKWFVLFTSFGYLYDGAGTYTHQSYDEWVGKIDCFEACEDLANYIDANEPVPMGEPYDIEYLGRTTIPGYLECEPPPRITISFAQISTC